MTQLKYYYCDYWGNNLDLSFERNALHMREEDHTNRKIRLTNVQSLVETSGNFNLPNYCSTRELPVKESICKIFIQRISIVTERLMNKKNTSFFHQSVVLVVLPKLLLQNIESQGNQIKNCINRNLHKPIPSQKSTWVFSNLVEITRRSNLQPVRNVSISNSGSLKIALVAQ